MGAGGAGFVERFGAGLAATRRAGRRRSLDDAESAEPEERRVADSDPAAAESDVEAGALVGVVGGDGARFGADRHAEITNTLTKTKSP